RISFESNIDLSQNKNIQHSAFSRLRDEGARVAEGENNSNGSSPARHFRYYFYAEKKLTRSKVLLSFSQRFSNRTSESDQAQHSFNRFYLFNDSLVDQSVLRWRNNDVQTLHNTVQVQVPIRKGINWDVYTRYNRELNRDLE